MPSFSTNPSGSLTPSPLTPKLEAEIRARRAAVTDSPWGSSSNGADQYTVQAGAWVSLTEGFTSSGDVANVLGDDGETQYRRASFIARSPRDIDTLLAEVDRLRGEVAELEAQRDKLIRWHEEDATELRRLYAMVPPAAASRRCMLHGSACDGDMEQAHLMQPARRAGGVPLLDPKSFDRPGQRAAARMLNDDDYPTFTAAEVASWQKSQGITAPAVEERPVSLGTECANCGHARNWHDGACVAGRDEECGCTNFAPKGGAR